MKLKGYVAVPMWIERANWLYPSTKRVLVAMLSVAGRRMTVRKTVDELATLSHCSRSTVYQAIRQLQERRIVAVQRQHRYSKRFQRIVYAANRYRLRFCGQEDGYILFPRELLQADITHAAFATALHLYRRAGRNGRCWPSLGKIADTADFTRSTVCRVLRQLRAAQLVIRYFCRKRNNAFSCNSYYPTAWVRKRQRSDKSFLKGGSPIFIQPLGTRKIVGDYNLGKEIYGVAEFGGLHKSDPPTASWTASDSHNFDRSDRAGQLWNDFEHPYRFDGTGVLVSVSGELADLM